MTIQRKQTQKPDPGDALERLTVRIEYVGVIAVACLVIGVIVGSSLVGRPQESMHAAHEGDVHTGDMSAMAAQIENIDSFDQLVQIGNEAYDTNNPQIAILAYEKALKIDSSSADVLTDLGTMYRAVGDFEKATAKFRSAMALDPVHAISRFNLGIVLMHDVKDYSGATAAFQEFLKISPPGREADAARQNIEQLRKLAE